MSVETTPFNKRLFVVWLILVGISVAYLWIDQSAERRGLPAPDAVVTVVAICLALVKVRIIMREFMEVRGAPHFLRYLTDIWVLVMAASMIAVYLAGRALA